MNLSISANKIEQLMDIVTSDLPSIELMNMCKTGVRRNDFIEIGFSVEQTLLLVTWASKHA